MHKGLRFLVQLTIYLTIYSLRYFISTLFSTINLSIASQYFDKINLAHSILFSYSLFFTKNNNLSYANELANKHPMCFAAIQSRYIQHITFKTKFTFH
jgi:hypothetical protein